MSEDYYGILGVSKGASNSEIKKAFREKAKAHHPDKGGDEAMFKKINEAYEVLGDEQKKAQYDQFGAAGPNFGGGGGGQGDFDFGGFSAHFGGFEDIFSSFFGGMSGGQSQGSRYTRGSDLEVDIELDFGEAIKGLKKSLSSRQQVVCEDCSGQGGKGKKSCSDCGGTGRKTQQMRTPFGNVAQQKVCDHCGGEGATFEKECKTCSGEGRVQKKVSFEVTIPPGINDGETLRMRGKGEAGRKGGSAGDLYLHVRVMPSEQFTRSGNNIHSTLKLSIFDALLGGKKSVETFWGPVEITIPESTRDGEQLRIGGKGLQEGKSEGAHIVTVEYSMPKKVSAKLRELLEQAKKLS